jgi:hypothetical protein
VKASKLAMGVVNEIMDLSDENEKRERLMSFKEYMKKNIPEILYI